MIKRLRIPDDAGFVRVFALAMDPDAIKAMRKPWIETWTRTVLR